MGENMNNSWSNGGLRLFYVAGSNDGNIWDYIDGQYTDGPSTPYWTIYISNNNYYSYYRLIITQINGSNSKTVKM